MGLLVFLTSITYARYTDPYQQGDTDFVNIAMKKSEFKQKHPMGPLVWEQMRKEADAYYYENNLIATNI
jgi:hypothetical protein